MSYRAVRDSTLMDVRPCRRLQRVSFFFFFFLKDLLIYIPRTTEVQLRSYLRSRQSCKMLLLRGSECEMAKATRAAHLMMQHTLRMKWDTRYPGGCRTR